MEGNLGCIGIVQETKNRWERRVPLVPEHVSQLVEQGIRVLIQPSTIRCYPDNLYEKAGAEITDDLSPAGLIIGVKEVPICILLPNRSYLFFSHTIKGQLYNMPLLDTINERKIRLFDYERICNAEPPHERLVAFGRFAGIVGMQDFLVGLGSFLLMRRMGTPFFNMSFAYMHKDLECMKQSDAIVAQLIQEEGLPSQICPLIFGFTSKGRCSQGAQEIFELFPHKYITPEELETFNPDSEEARHTIYGVVFCDEHMVAKRVDGSYNREEYRSQPSLYKGIFAKKYLPYISCLIHGMYWDQKFPRLIKTTDMRRKGLEKFLGICDITCDYKGSIEFLRKFTMPDDPFLLYNSLQDRIYSFNQEEFAQNSILYHPMDFLPSELPRDASYHFSTKLLPFLPELANNDFTIPFSDYTISPAMKNAMITSHGALTPKYEYINDMRAQNVKESLQKTPVKESLEARLCQFFENNKEFFQDIGTVLTGSDMTLELKEQIINLGETIQGDTSENSTSQNSV